MSDERGDEHTGRASGSEQPYGGPYDRTGQQYGPYGWARPPSSDQYGQYGQYGQPQATPYGQYGPTDPYGGYAQPQAQYGPPYTPYGTAGHRGVPGRPGSVVTSAVLAFVYGAFGLLAAVGSLTFGAVVDDLVGAIEESDPSLGSVETGAVDAARAGLIVVGLVALAWTVVMVWGAVLAIRGRSRVLLLVGGSTSIAVTGFLLVAAGIAASDPATQDAAAGVAFALLLFVGAVAIVVLLCLRSAAEFFAAHRFARAR